MPELDPSETSISLLLRMGRDPLDQQAWGHFVDRYGPKIHAWCRTWGLQQADTEDVTQAVLAKLAVQMRRFQYDATKSFHGWLRVLAQHAWHDGVSERRRSVGKGNESEIAERIFTLEARDDLTTRLTAEFDLELLEEAERRVRLRATERTWEAYYLTAVQDLPGALAAERLGMKVASVFVAKSNVLKSLRDEVKALGGLGDPASTVRSPTGPVSGPTHVGDPYRPERKQT